MAILNRAPAASCTLRVLSALLGYPDARLRAQLPEMHAALREEAAVPAPRLAELGGLINSLMLADPLEAEAEYVQIFDCGRATSLHLFEHVHGDSRDRGPAMIDLARTYEQAGLFLEPGELPDYLPAVLEFASTQPPREARAFLGEMTHILDSLHAALAQRGTRYAAVAAALLEIAGEKPTAAAPAAEPPIDESWIEPPAFDGCSVKGQARPDRVQPIHLVRRKPETGAAA
ncbi:MAG: nitrate reductase molybdenum cofactor assembly chaperone [Burkholderiales bacterium]|nr:nitrate reductase molybdenum cofactor assembly chaperone [Burkholderiales bacterium]